MYQSEFFNHPSMGMEQPDSMNNDVPTYAHGGHISAPKGMIWAHFAPEEIELMDELQGIPDYDRRSGAKVYRRLGEDLSHPHIVHALMEEHAKGGHVGSLKRKINQMAAMGRHGDTEMVLIPKHMARLFDQIAGHKSINPHTGCPEYFSLSGLFSAAKNMFGRAKSGLSNLFKKKGAGLEKGLVSGLGSAAQAKLSGKNWKDAGLSGLAGAASGYDNPFAKGIGAAANAKLSGQNWQDAGLSGLADVASNFDNPLAKGIGSAVNSKLGGGTWKDAGLSGLADATSNFDNPLATGVGQATKSLLSGQNAKDALSNGLVHGLAALPGYMDRDNNVASNGVPTIEPVQDEELAAPQAAARRGGRLHYGYGYR